MTSASGGTRSRSTPAFKASTATSPSQEPLAGPAHVEGIAHDEAVESHLLPEDSLEDFGRERRGPSFVPVEGGNGQVPGHDRGNPRLDGRSERDEALPLQAIAIVMNHGKVDMGIDVGLSVPGKMLRGRQDPQALRTPDVGAPEFRDALRRIAERARVDDRVIRIGIEIEDRIQQEVDAKGPRFPRGHVRLKLEVRFGSERPHRHGPGKTASTLDPHGCAPFVVGRHEQRKPRFLLQAVSESGGRERIPFEEDDASDTTVAGGFEQSPEERIGLVHEGAVRTGIDELSDFFLEAQRRERLLCPVSSFRRRSGFRSRAAEGEEEQDRRGVPLHEER